MNTFAKWAIFKSLPPFPVKWKNTREKMVNFKYLSFCLHSTGYTVHHGMNSFVQTSVSQTVCGLYVATSKHSNHAARVFCSLVTTITLLWVNFAYWYLSFRIHIFTSIIVFIYSHAIITIAVVARRCSSCFNIPERWWQLWSCGQK